MLYTVTWSESWYCDTSSGWDDRKKENLTEEEAKKLVSDLKKDRDASSIRVMTEVKF